MSQPTEPHLTPTQIRELAAAEQTGADDVYGGNWPQALRHTAATWTTHTGRRDQQQTAA